MARSNEWNETLEETVIRSRAQNGLLDYSMVEDEVIKVDISGITPEGVEIEQNRTISARALGTPSGTLEIIDDTSTTDNWLGRVVSLGSYTFSIVGIEVETPRLLRGFIASGGGVIVDPSAQHFTSDIPPIKLMAEYETLFLEDQFIF